MSTTIQTLIEKKAADLAQIQETRKWYNDHYGHLAAVLEQDIYELNIKLQLAEADTTFYTAEQAATEDKQVSELVSDAFSARRAGSCGQCGYEACRGYEACLYQPSATAAARPPKDDEEYEDEDDPCYHCGRAIHACLCPSAPTQQEVEDAFEAGAQVNAEAAWGGDERVISYARSERTVLKWQSSSNRETYRIAVVKKNGILEVKNVVDGGALCHDSSTCKCKACSEIHLSNRLGVGMPPWRPRRPLTKTFYATESDWRISLPFGGNITVTEPQLSDKALKALCLKPLTGTTDGLKLKELEERFPGATMVLSTSKKQLEIEHFYQDIACYPDEWCHLVYCKEPPRAVTNFLDLDLPAQADKKVQLMAEWKGLYIDLSHLF